ncbi:MaoC family dehydratase N-terminal domain-containing protein [Nocardioides sp. AN3]
MDSSIVGRQFPPVGPYLVSAEKVREFASAIGWEHDGVPPTFPIVLAGASMNAFLDEVGLELSRIVHGEQRFSYERELAPGDQLTSTLTVASLRQIGGNDIIGTSTTFTDGSGTLLCTATATLVHRGAAA